MINLPRIRANYWLMRKFRNGRVQAAIKALIMWRGRKVRLMPGYYW